MSRKRSTVDGEDEDVVDEEDGQLVDATPAPKRQRVAKMRASAELTSHTDDMTVDDTQTSRSESGDQQLQLGDTAQNTGSRRPHRPRRQRTPPSRMETLLSQVPVEVWERVVPRLDASSALALFSINTHMVDMGDLYQVDNQPLRSTLVSTLGEIGLVVVKFGHKRHRVPRLNRLYLNRALFELFGENSVPECMHAEDLPRVCGRSLPVLHCVLRRTKLSKCTNKALLKVVYSCVPFREARYGALMAAGAPKRPLQSIKVNADMDAIYNGKIAQVSRVNGKLGDPDSMGRTLVDVPLSNVEPYVKYARSQNELRHTSNALTQVFVGHGVAGVKEATAMGLSGCDGMLACIAEMLPEAEWPKALQALCESENLTLLQELRLVLDNGALVSCVLSTLPMDALVMNAPADALHRALIMMEGEEKAMAALVEHAKMLCEAALRDWATERWIARTPQIVSQVDNDAVVQLYRRHHLQEFLAVLVDRKAWELVIDVVNPLDLMACLRKKGMVLPQEHLLPFLERALDKSVPFAQNWDRNNAVLLAVKLHAAQLDVETILECYRCDHDKRLLPILCSKDDFDDDDRALWVPYEVKENVRSEAIRACLQKRWQQQLNRCVSVCRENGTEEFVNYVRQWMRRTVRRNPCNDSEVMAVAMEGLENEDVVKVGELVNAEELEKGRWSKELATEERWVQLLDDGCPVKVLGIMMPLIDGFLEYGVELQRRVVRGLIEHGMTREVKPFLKRPSKLYLAKDVYPYLYELDSSTAPEKVLEIHVGVGYEMLLKLLLQYKDPHVLEALVSRIPFMMVTKGMYEAVGGEKLGEETQKRWEKVEEVRQECHAQRGKWRGWARKVLSSDSDDMLIHCQVLLECGHGFGKEDWTNDVSEGGANFLASLGIRLYRRRYGRLAPYSRQTEKLKKLREVYRAFEM